MRLRCWMLLLLAAAGAPAQAACERTCASRPEGCGPGFGTIAYVVSSCRVVGGSQISSQELRVHQSGCEPITVMRIANPEPVDDPVGLCALVGRNHLGTATPVAGVFQRLGVTQNGKGVVFEINNTFQLIAPTPLAPEAQGFFYVRADGMGLRRLGPPSRDPTYRLFTSGGKPAAEVQSNVAFSPDDRLMAYTDVAPGPDGVDTVQLFTMDIRSGTRRQVTQVTAGAPPKPGRKSIDAFLFVASNFVSYTHWVDGSERIEAINTDGTRFRVVPPPEGVLDREGHVVQVVQRSRQGYGVVGVGFPGPAANADLLPDFGPPAELFTVFPDGNLIQLTNFRYGDTAFISARPHDVMFTASADPVGANPLHNCQLFRVSPFGAGLRQVTRFGDGRPSGEGCQIGPLAGCGIRELNHSGRRWPPAISFYSDCDPLGTNPDGSQVFAVRADGTGLQQITSTRGVTTDGAGGVVEVEIPGPAAFGGPRRRR